MFSEFVQAKKGGFYADGRKIMLRGFSIGSWMDMESFMIRIPGTEKRIRQAFSDVYGKENSERFFDDFLNDFINEDDFKLLKSLDINVLRFPFDYRHFQNDQEPGRLKLEGFKHLDRVLDLCAKYGIFAILDLHSSPGGQNPDSHGGGDTGVSGFWEDAASRERIINLWGQIAKRYKDNKEIAGYDILNEPCYVADLDAFNDFYDRVIEKIREVDANHILFLEGDDWAKDFSVFRKLGGHQQALSFHFYPGQHVYMSADREERKAELERKLSYFIGLRESTGMPLWVGETGGNFPKDKLAEGLGLVKDCLDLLEKHGISWTLWTYKDAGAMGMVYPKESARWTAMGNAFRLQWQHKSRSNPTIAAEVFEMLEDKYGYSIAGDLKEKLKFRVFAMLNELHDHQLVRPKLLSTPWEEIRDYPQSFLLENCEGSEEIAELVRNYTQKEEGKEG